MSKDKVQWDIFAFTGKSFISNSCEILSAGRNKAINNPDPLAVPLAPPWNCSFCVSPRLRLKDSETQWCVYPVLLFFCCFNLHTHSLSVYKHTYTRTYTQLKVEPLECESWRRDVTDVPAWEQNGEHWGESQQACWTNYFANTALKRDYK